MRKYALFLLLLTGCRELTDEAIRRMRLYCLGVIGLAAAGVVLAVAMNLWWLWFVDAMFVGYFILRLIKIAVTHKIEKVTVTIPMPDHGFFADKGFSFLAGNCQIYACEDSQMKLCPLIGSEIYLIRCRCGCYCTYRLMTAFLYKAWMPVD